jgi:energy-coupling factor transporter ATP-binding protein EcfA2
VEEAVVIVNADSTYNPTLFATMNDLLKDLTFKAARNLRYDQPLDPDEDKSLLVELQDCRGDFSEAKLLWSLRIDESDHTRKYILFGGHRGCGKSTELRRLAAKLHQPDQYYVVLVDALREVDINNLNYSDILLAQAKVLLKKLQDDDIKIQPIFFANLENWFRERISSQINNSDFKIEVKAGATAETGLPFLGKLFASLTNSISTGSTYKEEIRHIVQNSFSEFAFAFNQLIGHAEEVLAKANRGKRILFIVDGTDRLRSDEAKHFFNGDVHQLKQISANFIYCTPITMLTEDGRIGQEFEVFRLPMLKITEKNSPNYNPVVMDKLKEFINKRVDASLFEAPALQEELITYSGGHLRDLIRLLSNCLAETRAEKKIDAQAVKSSVKQLATEYQRLIKQDDYGLLVEIDSHDSSYVPVGENTRRLLYDLVLLEYNSYWWQSHPVVRTLAAYQQAKAAYS